MTAPKVELNGVMVRFRLSYDKTWTLLDKAVEVGNRLVRKRKPRFFTALEDASLTINEGEIVGIIGPNGSGKTTLLRTISGIYHPDAGSVTCRGRISTLLSLGTGFDNRLTGLDNIRLNGLLIGISMKEIEDKIPMIAEFADIGDHIHTPMKYYSSGMISRVSFAIVVAMRPDILLIDEVFSVGDLAFQRKSQKAMHELLSRASCQLIVSHNLSLIREHCNRVIYLESGHIVVDGAPEEAVAAYEKDSA